MSNLSAFPYIQEGAEAKPSLWNEVYSILSANLAAVAEGPFTSASTQTLSFSTNIEVIGGGHFQQLSIGSTPPSVVTTAAVTIAVNSAFSDYLYLTDSSGARSNYVIGSRAGGTADGLNIWDASGATMIVSFSKQSIRFYQNVTGPVFDVGGALAATYNAATFGTGADSKESRIQAAINQAVIDNFLRVYIPQSMLPYSASSVSFSPVIRMIREGGNPEVFDVLAYGASGTGITNDTPAIMSAISGAKGATSSGFEDGGVVYFSDRTFGLSSPITVGKSNIYLQGVGPTTLFPLAGFTGSAAVVVTPTSGTALFLMGFQMDSVQFNMQNISALTAIRLRSVRDFTILRNVNIRNQGGAFVDIDRSSVVGGLISEGISFYDCFFNSRSSNNTIAIRLHEANEIGFYNTKIITANASNMSGTGVSIENGCRGIVFVGSSIAGWNAGIAVQGSGDSDSGREVMITDNTFENLGIGISLAGNSANSMARLCHVAHNRWLSVTTIIKGDFAQNNMIMETPAAKVHFTANSSQNMMLRQYAQAAAADVVDSGSNNVIFGALSGQLRFLNDGGITLNRGSRLWEQSSRMILQPTADVLDVFDIGGGVVSMSIRPNSILSINDPIRIRDGTAGSPAARFGSEEALGWYRSGASTMALSYGTLSIPMLWASSGISVTGGLNMKAGANRSCGTAVLGSNGSVNVANTYVATGDLIFLTDQAPGGTLGDLEMTGIRNASGFTIASTSVTDTSTVAWLIVRPT